MGQSDDRDGRIASPVTTGEFRRNSSPTTGLGLKSETFVAKKRH